MPLGIRAEILYTIDRFGGPWGAQMKHPDLKKLSRGAQEGPQGSKRVTNGARGDPKSDKTS